MKKYGYILPVIVWSLLMRVIFEFNPFTGYWVGAAGSIVIALLWVAFIQEK